MHIRLAYLRIDRKGDQVVFDTPNVVSTYKQTPRYVTIEAGQRMVESHDHEVSISGLISAKDVSALKSLEDRAVHVHGKTTRGLQVDGIGVLSSDGNAFVIKYQGTKAFKVYR